MELAQQAESYLDDQQMIHLVDIFRDNYGAAKTYLNWKNEGYHKAWVTKQLADAGI